MVNSEARSLGAIQLPEPTGIRQYMVQYQKGLPFPENLTAYRPIVDDLLERADAEWCYVTVDEGPVQAGETQRRGGVHIDGNWTLTEGWHTGGYWGNERENTAGGIILVSTTGSTRFLTGKAKGHVYQGGEYSGDLEGLTELQCEPNTAYLGNVNALHEALPEAADCVRGFLRLILPKNYQYNT